MRFPVSLIRRIFLATTALALLLVFGVRPLLFHAQAATFPKRSVTLSDSFPGATVRYKFAFIVTTPGAQVGSVRFQFCADTPLVGEPCVPPAGFDATAATILSQQNNTGFGIGSATANEIIISRTPSIASIGMTTVEFGNIVNPSSTGSYFARIETFGSNDGSGPHVDYGGVAYAINTNISVTTEVPPFLLFCEGLTITGYDCSTATGNYVNFGELSSKTPRTGTTQMVIATNASNGYTLTMNGTTMLSGVNSIPALSSNDVSRPGTSQFGVNLAKNADPSVGANVSGPGSASASGSYAIPNRYRFVSGEVIASSNTSDDYRKYTVSYVINIAKSQPAGVYVSTLTYVALASF